MSSKESLQEKIWLIFQELTQFLLEREAVIEAALLAVLTSEHLLLLGPPGTAKSLLVRSLCQRIEGTIYFERLLTKFSTPEELFGPLSLQALENDRYQRVTGGTLVEAEIAFLDEVFKANSAILNSLLGIMGERVYFEAGKAVPVPLLSLFGASNETPEDESLAALYDRFLLRLTVPYLTADDSLRALLELELSDPAVTIDKAELAAARAEVLALALEPNAREAIVAIKHALEEEGIAASDRRWRACAKLMRAKAWLAGQTTASSEQGEVLIHALWNEPREQRACERAVSKVVNPLNLEAVELEDAARDLFDQRPPLETENLTEALQPLMRQLEDIHTRLEQRINAAPSQKTARAQKALAQVETWQLELSQMALRSLTRLHLAPGS